MTSTSTHAIDPRALKLEAASDPIPSSVERGPVARMHWRHGLNVDAALASTVVDTAETPAEWSSLLAETHAALLDPSGCRPLDTPSPIGVSVVEALEASDAWPTLADAAKAHPMIAREAVRDLAGIVLDALKRSGAKPTTDGRRSLADLEAARLALEAARRKQIAALTPDEKREATRAMVAARENLERAEAQANTDAGIGNRAAEYIEDQDRAIAALAAKHAEKAEASHTLIAALGDGSGIGNAGVIADDLVKLLTKKITKMLAMVGALRKALSSGRTARHVRGREGMMGPTQGGVDYVADLTVTSLAALGGFLGAPFAQLTRLALVEGRADIVEKGGGIARNGDVVVVIDKSGSMQGAREEWAGAVALAVILEARKDGRNVALVTYEGRVRHAFHIDSMASLARAIAACGEGSDGDNNEHRALKAAGKLLGEMRHGGDPADILMITDGQWDAANTKNTGIDRARLHGCFIGGSAPTGAGFASAWEVRAEDGPDGFAEAVIVASSLV